MADPVDLAVQCLVRRRDQLRHQMKARADDIAQIDQRRAFACEQIASAECEITSINALLDITAITRRDHG